MKLIKTFLEKILELYFNFLFPSRPGSNQYLQDSCSDTENGLCDTDSFGSRMSGNGSGSVAGEFKHIKEEIENDEDYFRLLANQTRTMRHFDGELEYEREKLLHEAKFQTRFVSCWSVQCIPLCWLQPFRVGGVERRNLWIFNGSWEEKFRLPSMPLSGLFVCFQTAGGGRAIFIAFYTSCYLIRQLKGMHESKLDIHETLIFSPLARMAVDSVVSTFSPLAAKKSQNFIYKTWATCKQFIPKANPAKRTNVFCIFMIVS